MMREAVKAAYDVARADPTNYTQLPDWDQLPVDMRCAFITVFAAGGRAVYQLWERQRKTSDSVHQGSSVRVPGKE